MTTIGDTLRREYRCAVQESGEDYKIPGGGGIIMSMDEIAKARKKPRISGKRCDDLVVVDMGNAKASAYIIEKKENPPASVIEAVKEKLQRGMHFVERFIEHHSELHGLPFDFEPVLVSKRIPFGRKLQQQVIKSRMCKPKRIKHVLLGDTLPQFSRGA